MEIKNITMPIIRIIYKSNHFSLKEEKFIKKNNLLTPLLQVGDSRKWVYNLWWLLHWRSLHSPDKSFLTLPNTLHL